MSLNLGIGSILLEGDVLIQLDRASDQEGARSRWYRNREGMKDLNVTWGQRRDLYVVPSSREGLYGYSKPAMLAIRRHNKGPRRSLAGASRDCHGSEGGLHCHGTRGVIKGDHHPCITPYKIDVMAKKGPKVAVLATPD